MTLLILSLLVLLSGPLLYKLVKREPRAFWGLDGFVLASVGGLIVVHVLPPTLEAAGGGALLAVLAGLVLPILAEQIRGDHHEGGWVHTLSLAVAFIGLMVHTVLDGVTLAAQAHDEVSSALAGAVLLHRLPVALLVWWLIRPAKGRRWASIALGAIAAATMLGFFVEESLHGVMEGVGFAYVQAFIAGSLLHVLAHHPPHEESEHGRAHHHAHDDCGHCHDAHDHEHDTHAHHDDPHHDHDHHHAHDDHTHSHKHDHHEDDHIALTDIDHDHVMRGHDDHHHHHSSGHALMSGIGALCGAALVMALPWLESMIGPGDSAHGHGHSHGHDHAHSEVVDGAVSFFEFSGYGARFWDLFVESAPALLLGYILAGVFAAFLPRASMGWMRRGSSPVQAIRGMIFGLPIPICSCGVVPLYQSLIRKGVPASAAMAFLIATPELGIEALLLSLPLLGVELTIARLICAALVALGAGWIVGRIIPTTELREAVKDDEAMSMSARLRQAADFGLREVLDETGPWILVGLAIAALLSQGGLTQALVGMPNVAQVMLFALISLPLYVCASGATPLAAGLIFAGASPGAALAFLLAGPATNVTTFGVLSGMHGKRIAALFGLVVIGLSVLMGIGVDQVLAAMDVGVHAEVHDHQTHGWWQVTCAYVLVALFGFSLLRTGPRHWMQTVLSFGSHAHDHNH